MKIKDRITGVVKLKGRDIKRTAKNWRAHSRGQRDMLKGVLDEIGAADALKVRKLKAGGYELLDGEMRSDEAPDFEWTCLVLDLDDAEADKFLATYDPLGAMADTRAQQLAGLLESVKSGNADVNRLLADIMPTEAEQAREDERDDSAEKPKGGPPEMALEPHEHYDYLVVLCTAAQEWNLLCELLDLKPEERRGRMGTSRAIRAEKLLPLLVELRELRLARSELANKQGGTKAKRTR